MYTLVRSAIESFFVCRQLFGWFLTDSMNCWAKLRQWWIMKPRNPSMEISPLFPTNKWNPESEELSSRHPIILPKKHPCSRSVQYDDVMGNCSPESILKGSFPLVFMKVFMKEVVFFVAAEVTQCGDLHIMTLFGKPRSWRKPPNVQQVSVTVSFLLISDAPVASVCLTSIPFE